MKPEQWRPIAGFADYEISDHGRVGMTRNRTVEGQPRDRGARSRRGRYTPSPTDAAAYTGKAPLLQYGEYGELTHKTIEQAGLTGEERKRALEMLKVQAAYLEIYQSLDFPTDPEGHTVDLSGMHMTQPKIAIAWTLALLGFRRSAHVYIKKRPFSAPGVYANAYTWVDSRAPDDAAQELAPQHSSADPKLPPDTRRLAALRDDDEPMQMPPMWSQPPVITEEWVDRETGEPCEPGDNQ